MTRVRDSASAEEPVGRCRRPDAASCYRARPPNLRVRADSARYRAPPGGLDKDSSPCPASLQPSSAASRSREGRTHEPRALKMPCRNRRKRWKQPTAVRGHQRASQGLARLRRRLGLLFFASLASAVQLSLPDARLRSASSPGCWASLSAVSPSLQADALVAGPGSAARAWMETSSPLTFSLRAAANVPRRASPGGRYSPPDLTFGDAAWAREAAVPPPQVRQSFPHLSRASASLCLRSSRSDRRAPAPLAFLRSASKDSSAGFFLSGGRRSWCSFRAHRASGAGTPASPPAFLNSAASQAAAAFVSSPLDFSARAKAPWLAGSTQRHLASSAALGSPSVTARPPGACSPLYSRSSSALPASAISLRSSLLPSALCARAPALLSSAVSQSGFPAPSSAVFSPVSSSSTPLSAFMPSSSCRSALSLPASPSSAASASEPGGAPAWLPYGLPERLPETLAASTSAEALQQAKLHLQRLARSGGLAPSLGRTASGGEYTPTEERPPSNPFLSEQHQLIFANLADIYAREAAKSGQLTAQEYVDILASVWQLAQKYADYSFAPFHAALREPFNFSEWSQRLWRPLVSLPASQIVVPRPSAALAFATPLGQVNERLAVGDNVVFLSNHQTEPDPQVIKLVFDQLGEAQLAEKMVFVAGHKVREDRLSKPFSLACNLICVHSKKHLTNPELSPEARHTKQRENIAAMAALQQLLEEGGNAIWVAPSGGRDREDARGLFTRPDAFDSKTLQMFRVLARKARQAGRTTHFFPMALFTAPICPPPKQVENELGETRMCAFSPVGLAVGEALPSDDSLSHEDFAKLAEDETRRLYGLITLHSEDTSA
ncbi:acyltransferase domain-containing protein [Besnoitia besnoiti]|uniref:Acyltransferase domain-containing protein n=1 Tax=Besnoitia besnoiti TaxID=94643 RepID=A0A2A9MCY8_BESBE|nr:acyltransferase domain-containing protein [Besnoitia besnoiti]PFH35739.1 acyltransferase domain-containing protein [Besnoitia besnoiti]